MDNAKIETRYHIIGYHVVEKTDKNPNGKVYAPEGHDADRRAAFKRAQGLIGPRRYDGAEVYDSMAKYGANNVWDIDISGRDQPTSTKKYPRHVAIR